MRELFAGDGHNGNGNKAKEHDQFQAQERRAYGGAGYETNTNDYQEELERIYHEWFIATTAMLLTADIFERERIIDAQLAELESELQNAGRGGLLEAMQLGANGNISSKVS